MKSKQQNEPKEKRPYTAPQIIYTGMITTRAGSGGGCRKSDCDPVDPADLFKD